MMESKKLLILGFGGHARSVADVALACGYGELVFVDKQARDGENFLGHPVITDIDPYVGQDWVIFPAAGDNRQREMQCAIARELGFSLTTLLSPKASIGAGASISAGGFVGHHAHVGPMARLGRACIINTGAIVEHECQVGDFCHVSVNAAIAGRSRLGDYSMLGAGATIIDQVLVCNDVVVGAGAVVNRTIEIPGTYVGVPVRHLKK
ncbi:NeuD/PglB/VioB family sugar acetyltransferase [Laribacter hongkongensis]|uniref:NeuD/PglB/VioB family sugar acetyltransferase n=1 Tax=Laribacter hongkongensis TaxID=168471 RepID=UPI001EFC81FC|nr:NeuD/PglB/VioB family sugar acetyltransferase [Laribacter hongkongensis]MCG9082779.1 NeuD/PglB/VioB family sugar acetyltransferase [Laribacter hongkongensis]MCG9098025.1 NeuD/PglB/VioB family sugar acetyltransferase [Laribacter hongkongensis]